METLDNPNDELSSAHNKPKIVEEGVKNNAMGINNVSINDYHNLKITGIEKNKFEKENVFEFHYQNYCVSEKLKDENRMLVEKIKNLEQKYIKEINILKNENNRLNLNKGNSKGLEQNICENQAGMKETNNEINELLKILENKDKEINNNKYKIQQYENDINLIVEDFEKKKKELEKEISQLTLKIKKVENDNKELKIALENEKNKNLINNVLLKEKNKKINYFHQLFELINVYKEKIINNDIDNQVKLNFEKSMNNKNDNECDHESNYGKIGIINHGLSCCYMNTVIQILKNIKGFLINILNYEKEDIITNSLRKLLNNLYYSKSKYISIVEFKKDFGLVYPKFADDKQNDSTVFLIYLLQHLNKVFKQPKKDISSIYKFKALKLSLSEENELKKFLNKYEANNNSYINDLFYGYQMNKITCTPCEHCQISFQSFNILDLPLVYENEKVKSLEESLNCYLITKDKHDIKGFECQKCGHKNLSYLTCIIKLPPILIIYLKRIGENTIYYHEIEIPQILKTKSIEKLHSINKQYELIGFIKHFGNEKYGHNVAFAKNIFDNKWYSFNDKIVEEEKGFPSTDKSFLLFYQIIENK